MLLVILLIVAVLYGAGMTFVAYRFYRRAVTFDTIFQFITDDIVANLQQFVRMAHSPITNGDPEVREAHQKMLIMGKRLEEILLRMEEATGLRLRPPPVPPRPKVV
jgi:hypothetical protein